MKRSCGEDWVWLCLVAGVVVMVCGFLIPRATIAQAALPPTYGQPLAYLAQPGDTFWRIAERAVQTKVMRCEKDLREAVDDLLKFNPGTTGSLQPGDRILIPVTNPNHPRPGVMAALMGCPGAELRLATPTPKK